MIKTDTAIPINGLEKSFKNVKVKTTTIKILSTLLKPDHRSAQACGFDVERQPE